MREIIDINSIHDIHRMLGEGEPEHPLITLIDVEKLSAFDTKGSMEFRTGFYTVALKEGGECEINYGRKNYDFEQGSLVFSSPGQIATVDSSGDGKKPTGWILCFHQDLIRESELSSKMERYTFFDYSTNEALHLSCKEKETITSIVQILKVEYSMNLDQYSNGLILSNLETLLNYCERFYGRQFITRRAQNHEGMIRFEGLLKERMKSEKIREMGIPTVSEFAKEMGYSTNYLSDMLMKETGRRPLDYIHDFIIERAKNLLLGTEENIGEIAFILGYQHPEHFSRFFKNKTGYSPSKFRKINIS